MKKEREGKKAFAARDLTRKVKEKTYEATRTTVLPFQDFPKKNFFFKERDN